MFPRRAFPLTSRIRTSTLINFRPLHRVRDPPRKRFLSTISEPLAEAINKYATCKQTPVTVKQLIDFVDTANNSFKSTLFLRSELPTRLAHMVKEFDSIEPPEVLETPPSKQVRSWYLDSFQDLMNCPSEEEMRASRDQEKIVTDFTQTLNKILNRHATVVPTMAQGILELKRTSPELFSRAHLHEFLDRFYTSRIGIRLLMQQHLELIKMKSMPNKDNYGVLEKKCNPAQIVAEAVSNAEFLCRQYYTTAPAIEIVTPTTTNGAVIEFPYVPSHLYHILFELVKNSLRAVVEKHPMKLPPVRIIIAEGNEDLTIKISDEGGGIKRSGMPFIFTYLYTTAPPPPEPSPYTDVGQAPLAGFGYGLPLARLYARYLGGDLSVISIEGFGTDAYIYLKRAADEAGEVLPSFDPKRNNL